MGKRLRLSLSIRKKIFKRDGWICTYCGKQLPKKRGEHVTVDHVVPKIKGGNDEENNLTTSCDSCNKNKGSLLLTQFLRAFEIKLTPKIARFL